MSVQRKYLFTYRYLGLGFFIIITYRESIFFVNLSHFKNKQDNKKQSKLNLYR